MCTAQVLLVNREVMRRSFGNDVNRRVCRRLFEPSDSSPVDPGVFLKRMQEEIRKKEIERWNFDFMTETPLPGRFQWEPVFANKNITATPESNPEDRVRQAVTEPVVEEVRKEVSVSSSKKKKGAGVPTQHKITDFLIKKKKRSSDGSSSSKLKMRRTNRNSESLAIRTRLR